MNTSTRMHRPLLILHFTSNKDGFFKVQHWLQQLLDLGLWLFMSDGVAAVPHMHHASSSVALVSSVSACLSTALLPGCTGELYCSAGLQPEHLHGTNSSRAV